MIDEMHISGVRGHYEDGKWVGESHFAGRDWEAERAGPCGRCGGGPARLYPAGMLCENHAPGGVDA